MKLTQDELKLLAKILDYCLDRCDIKEDFLENGIGLHEPSIVQANIKAHIKPKNLLISTKDLDRFKYLNSLLFHEGEKMNLSKKDKNTIALLFDKYGE
jgi:hypothetical protein